jgi:hypothetical protein
MIAQNVAELFADHVRLTVEAIDRMYLNVYVPRLQWAYGAVSFFRDHRGQPTIGIFGADEPDEPGLCGSTGSLCRPDIGCRSCCSSRASAKTT